MTNKKIGFADFGTAFQEKLAFILATDKIFADQMREVLEIKYFEPSYLQSFIKKIYAHKDEYKSYASKSLIGGIINDIDTSDSNAEMINDFWSRFTDIKKIEDEEYVKDMSLKFCKKRKIQQAILKSVDHLETLEYDEIRKLIEDAMKLGMDKNYGHDIIEDFDERYKDRSARDVVSTGWARIDALMDGGHGKGELGVVVAPTGAGKTHVLVHLGAHAFMNGLKVVHYSLELSEDAVAMRYDACCTGVQIDFLRENRDFVKEKMSHFKGKVIVKSYPTKVGTVGMIRNHLDKLISQGVNPDLIIVDYADLLKSTRSLGEKRHEAEETYEELRGLSRELEAPIWTASQTNRSGLNAELVTHASIAEAYNKCFPADFIITLSRTIEDKNTDSGRFFIAKNRNGADGIVIPINMDTSRTSIRVMSEEEEEMLNQNKSMSDADRLRNIKNMLLEKKKKNE